MISSLAQVFVERREPHTLGAAGDRHVRLLVVDATSHGPRIIELFSVLERQSGTRVSFLALEDLGRLPEVVSFDVIWVVAGCEGELSYCNLVAGELAQRFANARVSALELDAAEPGGPVIERSTLIDALPWRRRRRMAACAQLLAEHLVVAT